jgi:hypothetical protein
VHALFLTCLPLTNFELQYFQKIFNLFFGPFAADVEKLALVCFSFVLFFAESTRMVKISTRIDQNFD